MLGKKNKRTGEDIRKKDESKDKEDEQNKPNVLKWFNYYAKYPKNYLMSSRDADILYVRINKNKRKGILSEERKAFYNFYDFVKKSNNPERVNKYTTLYHELKLGKIKTAKKGKNDACFNEVTDYDDSFLDVDLENKRILKEKKQEHESIKKINEFLNKKNSDNKQNQKVEIDKYPNKNILENKPNNNNTDESQQINKKEDPVPIKENDNKILDKDNLEHKDKKTTNNSYSQSIKNNTNLDINKNKGKKDKEIGGDKKEIKVIKENSEKNTENIKNNTTKNNKANTIENSAQDNQFITDYNNQISLSPTKKKNKNKNNVSKKEKIIAKIKASEEDSEILLSDEEDKNGKVQNELKDLPIYNKNGKEIPKEKIKKIIENKGSYLNQLQDFIFPIYNYSTFSENFGKIDYKVWKTLKIKCKYCEKNLYLKYGSLDEHILKFHFKIMFENGLIKDIKQKKIIESIFIKNYTKWQKIKIDLISLELYYKNLRGKTYGRKSQLCNEYMKNLNKQFIFKSVNLGKSVEILNERMPQIISQRNTTKKISKEKEIEE